MCRFKFFSKPTKKKEEKKGMHILLFRRACFGNGRLTMIGGYIK